MRAPDQQHRSKRFTSVARLILTVGLVTGSVLLGWALLWPETACNEPACARKRFALAVEVDAFRQVSPIEFDVPVGDRSISLHSILASGGVEATVLPDQFDLPYKASSGALDRADLQQFAAAWRNAKAPPGVDAKIYALLAPALVCDTGEPLLGIMFDVAEREGFAVAPSTTAHQFGGREEASIQLLQLRTFAHELLHSLNRPYGDSLRPTLCVSDSCAQTRRAFTWHPSRYARSWWPLPIRPANANSLSIGQRRSLQPLERDWCSFTPRLTLL